MAVVARFGLCLVLLVVSRGIHGKPFWGGFFCDFFCEDDDSSSSSSETSLESFLDTLFDPCAGCPASKKPKASTTTPKPEQPPQPVSLIVPPSSLGLNVTLGSQNDNWTVKLSPWSPPSGPAAPPAATTAAPAAPAAAPTAAADAAATTAAAAAETTAAPAA